MNLQQLAADISAAYEPPSGAGRPASIGDPDIVQEFLTQIEAGNYPEIAAELAGISLNTYRNWMKRGEDGETPFTAFMQAVKRAAARAEAMEIAKVRKAGNDPRFWAASMTYLERRHPERWARRSEDGNTPRVVVQIGVRDSDVQVSIASSPAVPQLGE